MEKRRIKHRFKKIGLNGLFWRYLISTGLLMAVLCIAWLLLFNILVNMGLVRSAYTAVRGLPEAEQLLKEQEVFDPTALPHFYEWALVENGEITDSSMNEKQLAYARSELAGDSSPHGWFYTQYFHPVPIQSGQIVLLEYDYSVCYSDPVLQDILPDFQTIYIGLLCGLLLLTAAMRTAHYTRLLRQDTQAITAACEMVRSQQLDAPIQAQARVRELQSALNAIDTLRCELSGALKEQWASEQQKGETLAALAHDLKTPLTVIGGNAELLSEDMLTPSQQQLVQTILRSAGHAEMYVQRLRSVTTSDFLSPDKEPVCLRTLFSDLIQCGLDLSDAKKQRLITVPELSVLSEETVKIQKNEVLRAVENLLSNAMRFTPPGKAVTLGITLEPERICLWVQDSGPGFSAEALSKAGKTLYTEDSSRPQDGHMGMGLYFVSRVAKAHGGSLSLQNTPTGGLACLWLKRETHSDRCI